MRGVDSEPIKIGGVIRKPAEIGWNLRGKVGDTSWQSPCIVE